VTGDWGPLNGALREPTQPLFQLAKDRSEPRSTLQSLLGCATVIAALGLAAATIILAVGVAVR